MKTTKQLGVWMDYSTAYVMELKGDSISTTVVESEFTWEEKQHSFFKNEGKMHNKERQLHTNYYKKIADLAKGFDEVVLFGPSDAKTELFNLLTEDPEFKKVKLSVETAHKLSENQREAFLKNHFHPTIHSAVL